MPAAATTRSASHSAGDPDFALDLDLDLDDIARAADAACIGPLACGRASFSYNRLPEPRLHLTIRKVDNSFFDVQITRSAAVWELKAAIESVFIALYDDMDNAVTWQHVWSHFCLCFKDDKLTDDKATLRVFGIKDGDELHFAQHLSVDYSPCKSSKSQRAASHRRSKTSVDGFGVRPRSLMDDLVEEEEGEKKLTATRHSTSVVDEGFYVYEQHEECSEENTIAKGSFFRNWFSYKSQRAASHRRSRTSVDGFGVRPRSLMDDLVEEDEGEKKLTATRHSTSVVDEGSYVYEQHEECIEENTIAKGSFFRNWFSYNRLRGNSRTHSENVVLLSCKKEGTRPSLGKWLSSKKSKARSK